MPRRSPNRSTVYEDRMKDHIQRFLVEQERSGGWFARQMNARGCEAFTNVTLHKILKGGRAIYVDEGVAIADILGLSIDELAAP